MSLGGAGPVEDEGAVLLLETLLLFDGAGSAGAALLLKDAGAVNGACGRFRRKILDPIGLRNNRTGGISIVVGDYPLSRSTKCNVDSFATL